MEFPRQASICQEGLRTPSQWQQEAESFTSPSSPFNHGSMPATMPSMPSPFIPPAEESEAIQRNKFVHARSGRSLQNLLTYESRSFFFLRATGPIQRRITVLRLIVPSPTLLSPIVGSPPPRVDRLHFLPVTGEVSLPLQSHFLLSILSFEARFKASSWAKFSLERRMVCLSWNWNFFFLTGSCIWSR